MDERTDKVVNLAATHSGVTDGGSVVDETTVSSTSARGCAGGAADQPRLTTADLPLRLAGGPLAMRNIRRMDDPEVLERVLDGLLKLL